MRRHLTGQLSRLSSQFWESRNDINSSVYRCRSASANPQTIVFRLQHIQPWPRTWRPLILP